MYALPLRHMKCDPAEALRRTVVTRLMVQVVFVQLNEIPDGSLCFTF